MASRKPELDCPRPQAQQNVLICNLTDPADIEPNGAPIGGYLRCPRQRRITQR
jgi:hypothetical protein